MKLAIVFALLSVSLVGSKINNLVVNSDFEQIDGTNNRHVASWQVLSGDYSQSREPGNVTSSNMVVEVGSSSGLVQRVVLNQTKAFPVRLTANVKGSNIVNDPNDKLGASLDCKIHFHDGTEAFCPTTLKTKSVGTFDWKWVGYNTKSIATSAEPIDWIDVRLRVGAVSGTAWFDDVTVEEWPPLQDGLVSFVFDDAFASTYTKAYPILSASGFVGSEAVITSRMETDSLHLKLSQLHEMNDHGWSVMSHTVTHSDLTFLTQSELANELYFSQKYLFDNGFMARHLALPFGSYNAMVSSEAQQETYLGLNYASMRSTDKGWNPQGVFPYNISVKEIDSNTTVENVRDWVNVAKADKSWLVLLAHEVDNQNGIYTVSSGTLKQMVDIVANSKIRVVTYDDGFKIMASKRN